MRSKFIIIIVILIILLHNAVSGEDIFNKYFVDDTLRIDYYHIGDAMQEIITLDRMYRDKKWAGNTANLIDPSELGTYMVKVYDREGQNVLYSFNYGSYFEEYRTTQPALNGQKRTFQETVRIPYPKEKVILSIESRDRKHKFREIFRTPIDPEDIFIINRSQEPEVEVTQILASGDCHKKVDILLVAEGYTEDQKEKFLNDSRRFMGVFFSQEPYIKNRNRFNFTAVFRPSAEIGCDEPSYGTFKNTAIGCSFDSLGSERYLLTEHNFQLRNICSVVPYDTIIILVNTLRYGGGGIYNLYATVITDNQWSDYVFLHEFGHSFAGLADEYYTSQTGYTDFYPIDIEPISPNITALIDKRGLKWKGLIKPGTPIPTVWDKETFDRTEKVLQEIRDKMNEKKARARRSKAKDDEIQKIEQECERLSRESAEEIDRILAGSPNRGVVGAFEGAGYRSTGLYRSMVDCIMFSKGNKPFCRVCQEALEKRILFYCE